MFSFYKNSDFQTRVKMKEKNYNSFCSINFSINEMEILFHSILKFPNNRINNNSISFYFIQRHFILLLLHSIHFKISKECLSLCFDWWYGIE